MREEIRQYALKLGFDKCGFARAERPDHAEDFTRWIAAGRQGEMDWMRRSAAKRVDPRQVLPGAKTAIMLASSYGEAPAATGAESEPTSGPRGVVARYARGPDYHRVLEAPLKRLSEWVGARGGAECKCLYYTDTGPILERDLAQRAGLGFIGKHTNLIGRGLGNWLLLAEILTTLEIPPDRAETNHCGKCARCLAACPTQAIRAPFELDARRCISYLTIELKGPIPVEWRPAIGNRIFGCDDCLAACPWNRFAREGALMRRESNEETAAPGLLDLMRLDEAGFKQRFAGTPILRTKRRGLLRNVCVALGNIGTLEALAALEKARREEEPLIAEHAAWAMVEIERRGNLPLTTGGG